MKTLFSVIIGIVVFCLMIFVVDKAIVNAIMSVMPQSVGEWFGLIKMVCWAFVLFFTFGLSIYLGILSGALIRIILGE